MNSGDAEKISWTVEDIGSDFCKLMRHLANQMNISFDSSLNLRDDNGLLVRKVDSIQELDILTIYRGKTPVYPYEYNDIAIKMSQPYDQPQIMVGP